MSTARELVRTLRQEPNITPAHLSAAASTIETLLDVIAMQRGPAVVTEEPEELAMRQLRNYHHSWWKRAMQTGNQPSVSFHARMVQAINQYFPSNDQISV